MDTKGILWLVAVAAATHFVGVFRPDIRRLYIYLFKRGVNRLDRAFFAKIEAEYAWLNALHGDSYRFQLWLATRVEKLLRLAFLYALMMFGVYRLPPFEYKWVLLVFATMPVPYFTTELDYTRRMLRNLNNYTKAKQTFEQVLAKCKEQAKVEA